MTQSNGNHYHSPPWNRPTKVVVAIGSLLFVLAVLWRFQALISPLIIAAVLSYLVYPIINFINERTHLRRSIVVNLVFVTIALIFIFAVAVIGLAVYRQALNLVQQIPGFIEEAPSVIEDFRETLAEPISIGTLTFSLPLPAAEAIDWQEVSQQVVSYLQPIAGRVGNSLGQLALGTVEVVGWMVFILFVSIYISNDAPKISQMISNAADLPGYRQDAERLWREFGRIWQSYLRGQAILGLILGVSVSFILGILGVNNALALGLLSGLLEFIPMIGAIIGVGAAVLVALFQDGNYLGVTSFQYALIVLGVMTLIQQIENNVLVPRIVGETLDLNPLVVLVGAIMGSSLAGILGAILAAPVMATIKLLGTYAWRKFFDMPPFSKPEPESDSGPSWAERAWERWQLRRAGMKSGRSDGNNKKK